MTDAGLRVFVPEAPGTICPRVREESREPVTGLWGRERGSGGSRRSPRGASPAAAAAAPLLAAFFFFKLSVWNFRELLVRLEVWDTQMGQEMSPLSL